MISPRHILAILLACTILSAGQFQASDTIDRVFPDASAARGVVVLAGLDDPQSAIELAKAAPVVILSVTANSEIANRHDKAFRAAGVIGQVTATTLSSDGRIPLAENTVATLIVNRDRLPGFNIEEARRVLRPYGQLHALKNNQWTKEITDRPAAMDDWTHFHKDPASTEHSRDTTVGPARGLQWVAGPTIKLAYNLVIQDTVFTHHTVRDGDPNRAQLIARDAFSGLPLWIKPKQPQNRFSIVAEGDRVYVHIGTKGEVSSHTVALDRRTGEQMLEFTEGLDFTVTKEEIKQNRHALQQADERAEDLQLRLLDGVLVQTIRDEICVLDAATGKKLWGRKAEEGTGFVHPTAGDGVLYVVEGEYTRHSSYTHWPMAKPDRIYAFDLHDGKLLWQFNWDEKRYGKAHAIYNLQLEGKRLGGAVTIFTEQKPQAHGLILAADTGKVIYWGREKDAWPGSTGAGHSHVRLHLRGDDVWTFEIGNPIATWKVDQPEKFFSFTQAYKGNLRPVSCTVWRSTPDWWFGGVGCYPANGKDRGYFNASGRSGCDIGAFPANGMIYSPPNTCACQPYLPGNKAYHSRMPPAPVANDSRLTFGDAKPAEAKNDGNGWPLWQRDAARRAWLPEAMPTDLKEQWQFDNPVGDVPELLATQWTSDAIIRGTVTQATSAGDIVVIGVPHQHQVVALDAKTGEPRWRAEVDGRVDMAPSIHNGLVLTGTRNGYVYALNRDTGELVWRFLAAPDHDRILVNGQLESPWPVFGSIPVDDDGLIAVAGRHSDSDGGLWWWQLEPATGKLLAHGRIGHDQPPALAANKPWDRPLDLPSTQNSVAVMTKHWFMLPGTNIRRVKGRLGPAGDEQQLDPESYASEEKMTEIQLQENFIRFGSGAIIGEPVATAGGWRKPNYANTLARIFAINGPEFVSVGGGLGTASGRGGGGDSKVHHMQLLDTPEEVKRQGKRYAEEVWVYDDLLLRSRELPSATALAVSENAVYVGMSIYGKDRQWREAREEMAHRIRIINRKDGSLIRDVGVSDRILQGGIALSGGRVIVATEDGKVTAFGAK